MIWLYPVEKQVLATFEWIETSRGLVYPSRPHATIFEKFSWLSAISRVSSNHLALPPAQTLRYRGRSSDRHPFTTPESSFIGRSIRLMTSERTCLFSSRIDSGGVRGTNLPRPPSCQCDRKLLRHFQVIVNLDVRFAQDRSLRRRP
jgi:hypothetical protein